MHQVWKMSKIQTKILDWFLTNSNLKQSIQTKTSKSMPSIQRWSPTLIAEINHSWSMVLLRYANTSREHSAHSSCCMKMTSKRALISRICSVQIRMLWTSRTTIATCRKFPQEISKSMKPDWPWQTRAITIPFCSLWLTMSRLRCICLNWNRIRSLSINLSTSTRKLIRSHQLWIRKTTLTSNPSSKMLDYFLTPFECFNHVS